MSDSIHQERNTINFINHQATEYYLKPVRTLINYLYKGPKGKPHTYQDVADVLGVSKQRIFEKFPKENHDNK